MSKIAIQTSSGLKATAGLSIMATASANSTGKTTAAAPVLLSLQSEETMDALALADAIQKLAPSFSVAEARYVVNAVETALVGIVEEATYPCNIQLGFATFLWEVAGSLDSADGTPSAATNYPFMTGLVPERYRRIFASYDTYVPTGDQPCVLKRVRDKATNASAIMGNNTFYLEGSRGMTYGGTGEKCELWDAAMTAKVCDLTVTNHDSPILWECKIPNTASVPVGRYAVRVVTLAGGAALGGTLYTVSCTANVGEAAVVPTPTITKVTQDGRPDNTLLLSRETPSVIHGTNLALGAGDCVRMELYQDGVLADKGDLTAFGKVDSVSETQIRLNGLDWDNARPDGDWCDAYPNTKLVIVKNGVRYEYPVTLKGD